MREDPGSRVWQNLCRVDDFGFQMHLLSNTIAIDLFNRMPNYSLQSATSSEKVDATDLTLRAGGRILQ